jgi:hypothetical protein
MLETSGLWVAYLRLGDPPGLSPVTTVGRYATVEAAQVATDDVWASRWRPSANDPAAVRVRHALDGPLVGGLGGPSSAPRMPRATELTARP